MQQHHANDSELSTNCSQRGTACGRVKGNAMVARRRSLTCIPIFGLWFCLSLFFVLSGPAQAQLAGQNVNMVSGTVWPYGDPFLERQDEPSLAVSTRNPLHLLAGANDYRTVDLNLSEAEPGEGRLSNAPTGEPWVGQYVSVDGGAHWQSTLLPGYPQDTSVRERTRPYTGSRRRRTQSSLPVRTECSITAESLLIGDRAWDWSSSPDSWI